MEMYESGFNDGFVYAAQVVASEILRSIDNHPYLMLPEERKRAKTHIKLLTRGILKRRKLIPNTEQVLTGQAERVELNFNLYD